MRITAINRPKGKRRYEVRIDDAQRVRLSRELLAAANLRAGQEITPERIAALELAEARQAALASAVRLLSYRPRSCREMRDALRARRFPEAVVDETMSRLADLRLLDDRAFADNWTESRSRNSPRSRRMILAELAQKGVSAEVASQSVAAIDDGAAAVLAARKRLASLRGVEYEAFRRKLGDFLGRRGFAYETCDSAIRALWAEVSAAP